MNPLVPVTIVFINLLLLLVTRDFYNIYFTPYVLLNIPFTLDTSPCMTEFIISFSTYVLFELIYLSSYHCII